MALLRQIPKKVLITSAIPLGISLGCFATQQLLSLPISGTSKTIQDLLNFGENDYHIGSLIMILSIQLQETILSAYHNIFEFITMMFILDILAFPFRKSDKQAKNLDASERSVEEVIKNSLKNKTASFAKNIIIYILCFLLCNLAVARGLPLLQDPKTSQLQGLPLSSPFEESSSFSLDLEEDHLPRNSRMLLPITSTPLQITTTLRMRSLYTVLSRDSQTLYVNTGNTLQIVNVTNPSKPVLLGSVRYFYPQFGSLCLTHDGNTLIIAGKQNVDIIDVSDPESPFYISAYNIRDSTSLDALPSVAISYDDKTVYLTSLYGFRIFNISDTSSPEVIYSNDDTASLLALSPDYNKLILTNEKEVKIYDVLTPTKPDLISSITLDGEITSVLFSSDSKSAYFCTVTQKISVQLLDLSAPAKPSIKSSQSLMDKSDCGDPFLSPTPEGELIYLSYCRTIQPIEVSTLKSFPLELDKRYGLIVSIVVPKSSKFAFIGCANQLVIARLYINLENSQSFALEQKVIAEVEDTEPSSPLTLSQDSKTAFILGDQLFNPSLYIYDISDPQNAEMLSQTSVKSHPNSKTYNEVIPSPSSSGLVYMDRKDGIEVMDVSDLSSPKHKAFIESAETQCFAVSSDEKSLFVVGKSATYKLELRVIDISTSQVLATLALPETTAPKVTPKLKLSMNSRALFYYNEDLHIIDVSDLSKPSSVAKVPLGTQLKGSNIALTPDEKAILVGVCTKEKESIEVISIANIMAPAKIGSVNLAFKPAFKTYIEITASGKTAFINSEEGVFVVDIQSLSTPIIVGQINQDITASALKLSEDQNTLFAVTPYGFSILNLQSKYGLFTENLNYGLGGTYTNNLKVIMLNSQGKYNLIEQNYKFTTLSLYNIEVLAAAIEAEKAYSPLPNWMTFDKEKGILKVEPTSQQDINTYNIYTRVSTYISKDDFKTISGFNNATDAQELLVSLITLGYMDTEGYITSNFDPSQALVLHPKYTEVEKSIRNVLSQHIIEMMTQIYVLPTLKLEATNFFEVSTLASHAVSVAIRLNNKAEGQFLTRTYPAVQSHITNNNTLLILNGDLTSINEALHAVTIDLKDTNGACSGFIFISDGLNPSISQTFSDISQYFVHNLEPFYDKNLDLQSQLDDSPIYTSQNFIIQIAPGTFTNANGLPLTWSLKMANPKAEFPSWLLKRDWNLVGTPPNKLSPLKIDLIMIIKNEYKAIEVPFTLNIRISAMYFLTLMGVYGGYLATIVGLWATSNKIYNVIWKKKYRYPKNFKVFVGEEINDQIIPPISFIADQILESKFIISRLIKQVNERNGINPLNEVLWVEKFIDSQTQQINSQLLLNTVEDVVRTMSVADRIRVKRFNSADDFQRDLIFQLILNRAIHAQLDLEGEKETKQAYEQIKSKWVNFISHNRNSQLVLKHEGLEKELSRAGICINGKAYDSIDTTQDQESERLHSPAKNRSFEKELLGSSSVVQIKQRLTVNADLLEKALVAYASKYHHIDAKPFDVDIQSLQKLTSSSPRLEIIYQFLKMDLKSLAFINKREVGGGIKYRIKNDTLHFYGTANNDIRDQTLVVQIMNAKRRILRELWIHGMEEGERKSLLTQVNEEL